MKWEKHGLLYCAAGESEWMQSHAMIPTPTLMESNLIKVYLNFCDTKGRARPGYIIVDPNNDFDVLEVSEQPLIDLGRPGTFDDNGAALCSIVPVGGDRVYAYYVGFELGVKVRYRMLSGLAVSEDSGATFLKHSQVPILERSNSEPFIRGGPFVLKESDIFKMWYVAGDKWLNIQGKSMPIYSIKYLESKDGIHWGSDGKECVAVEHPEEFGFGRPYVIRSLDGYRMFYSIRHTKFGYLIGYAESEDGINWERMDERFDLLPTGFGWDSKMICYAAFIQQGERVFLFYNGNGFGETGVGVLELTDW